MRSVGPFDVKYELGHSYRETWVETNVRCPNCGEQDVWQNDGGGDYYEGPQHICTACEWTFTMPRLTEANDWQDTQRLAAIRGEKPVVSADVRKGN